MEMDMELSKKTTLLFPPELHERLSRLAAHRGVSLGDLVRRACEAQYGAPSVEERTEAVERLRALSLPVGTPARMKQESVPSPDELLP
jgi:predicted DNA-binding protein